MWIHHFDSDCFTTQDDHFDNTKDDRQTQCDGGVTLKIRVMLQPVSELTILCIQAKSETSTFFVLLHGSIQSSVTHFYKYIEYYAID